MPSPRSVSKKPISIQSAATESGELSVRIWAIGALVIMGLVFALYWPARHGDFILDDDLLLTDNALIKASDGLYRIWFTWEPVDYWPVTNSVFWFQWRLFGMDPTGYHVTNLILHVTDCLLLWQLLRRLAIPGAFLAALLFAVHPVNVESVAWIAQLKNVLSLMFFLISALCYLNVQQTFNRWYFFSLLLFILAMLSKSSVVVLPLMLLLVLWWQNGRITNRDLWQIAPFVLVAIALILLNNWVQTHGAHLNIRSATFSQRLAGAGLIVWFYLYKAILPINLIFVYPQWNIATGNLLGWLPLTAVLVATIALLRYRNSQPPSWGRNLLFAWMMFCAALLPVLGFVDAGYMKYSLVADHYQHIALIAVVAAVSAAATVWYRSSRATAKPWITGGCVAAVAGLAILTLRQSSLYADSNTLYQTTLEQNPGSSLIHTNRSLYLANAGRLQEALQHAQEAVRLNPDFAEAHSALGVVLGKLGQTDQAIQEYQAALKADPNYGGAANNLGIALAGKGQLPEALHYLQRAVQLNSDSFSARSNFGRALAAADRLPEALEQLEIAVRLHPDYAEGEINMGNIAHALKRNQEAIAHFQRALAIKPSFPEAYIRIARVEAEMDRPAQAVAAAQTGIDLAHSAGDSELEQQMRAWLTNYRAQQSGRADQNP